MQVITALCDHMNLLEKYIPDFSGHIEGIYYDLAGESVEIVFYDEPEEFNPKVKLVFSGVCEYQEAEIEEIEEDCVELVIGLDEVAGGYCLHTNSREINFKAKNVLSISVST